MQALCQAQNQHNQAAVAALIVEHDFSDKPEAANVAYQCFLLTPDNIAAHPAAAQKLSTLRVTGLKLEFRQVVIKSLCKTYLPVQADI